MVQTVIYVNSIGIIGILVSQDRHVVFKPLVIVSDRGCFEMAHVIADALFFDYL